MSKRILYLGLDPTFCQREGEIVHWPIIQIVPRPLEDGDVKRALTCFSSYSHVIITSKSTIPILFDYIQKMRFPKEIWEKKTILAIGKVTAHYLEKRGIHSLHLAQEETAEGMVHLLKSLHLNDKKAPHLFWPHSAGARSVISDFLIEQGWRYTSCILYDTLSSLPGDLPRLDSFDEIVFTSPSTVKAFVEIFETLPSHLQLIPIGPITACYLNEQLSH